MNLNPRPRRSDYRYSGRKPKAASLRYSLICDGAVIKFADGREVCQPTPKGSQEYRRRIQAMAERQDMICCICRDPKKLLNKTPSQLRRNDGQVNAEL